jgi:hypothetical protein
MSAERPPYDESFAALQLTQQELGRHGYFFHAVPREHTEDGITDPLVHRLHTQITKRHFVKMAGHVLLSFSGYAEDEREIFAIPEIRSYWRTLDQQLPELPALVAYLPELRFNGPGFHLMLLGNIDQTLAHPERGIYEVHVTDATTLITDALHRIEQSSRKYHLPRSATQQLLTQFMAGATHRLGPL